VQRFCPLVIIALTRVGRSFWPSSGSLRVYQYVQLMWERLETSVFKHN